MRCIATACTVLLSLLAFSGWAFSQHQNEIGLFLDPDDLSTTSISLTTTTPIYPYLVILNPYAGVPDYGIEPRPVEWVSGVSVMVATLVNHCSPTQPTGWA